MKNQEMIALYESHIAILESDLAGKTIQIKLSGKWEEKMTREGYDFDGYEYRVKPNPPCLYGYMMPDGKISLSVYSTQDAVEKISGHNAVKLILAPDEEQPF